MSELIQKEKTLTLEDIAPIWAWRIKQGLTEKDFHHTSPLHCKSTCVVGEAYGFKGSKLPYWPSYGCDECNVYSTDILYKKAHPDIIQGFVDHWNEVHVK
jgi:hypothetical protein